MKKIVQQAIGVGIGMVIGIGIGVTIGNQSTDQVVGENHLTTDKSETTADEAAEIEVNKTLEEVAAIEVGTTQEEVHSRLGEPDGGLSGLYGDIYEVEDTRVVIYYEFNEEAGFPVTEIKITEVD